jgi:hypothetical protein
MIMFGVLLFFTGAGIGQEKISMNDWVEKVNQGAINWTAGYIEAVGIGAPAEKLIGRASSRPMALREAKRDALRNLLEITKGIQVNSTTTIKDFTVNSDIINTQVNALVKGAVVANQQYIPDGTAEVKLRMPLYGDLVRIVVPAPVEKRKEIKEPEKPAAPAPPPAAAPPAPPAPSPAEAPASAPAPPAATPPSVATPSSTSAPPEPSLAPAPAAPAPPAPIVYTGMVVDARGVQARPAMLPRVFDEDGKEVYGSANVDREFAVKQGMSGYTHDLTAAQSNQRVTANPVIVRALKTSGPGKSDIIISNADAQKIRSLEADTAFMKQCRVMIVLD